MNLLEIIEGRKLKTYEKKELEFEFLKQKYTYQFLNDLCSMLEYENAPDGLEPQYLELYRLLDGQCAVVRDGNKIVPITGGFSGNISTYGIGERYVGTDLGGNITFDGIIGKDCVVFRNNFLMFPDLPNVLEYADMVANVKISKKLNVIYSRYLPLFKAADGKTKDALDLALKNIDKGIPSVMLANDIEQALEGFKSVERIDITEVRNNDMLQYIAKFEDDLMRGFYTYYGHNINTSTKLAQESVKEVTSNESVSAIYPLQRLAWARRGCEELNALFGTNMTVKFSEAWECRHNDLIEDIKESDENDNSNLQNNIQNERPDENIDE